MRLSERIGLILLWFVGFWLAPAFLANLEFGQKTREAEQFLQGHRAEWFYHGDRIYGCLGEHQRVFCDTQERYKTDDFVLGLAKGNHLP